MYQVVYPKSEFLKPHIISFNILRREPDFKKITYLAFPQKGITLGFFNRAKASFNQTILRLENGGEEQWHGFLGRYLVPLEITYHNWIEEIAINFSPTGINYFFPNYFSEIAPNEIQLVSAKDSPIQLDEVFAKEETMVEKMEEALLTIYHEIEIKQIENAVKLIEEDPTLKTKDLAEMVYLTEKTLNRNFQKYVGCTTTQFRKICKFRDSVDDFFRNRSEKTLTQICLDNFYYDSAHFHREFNKIATFNPKTFFDKVSNIGRDNYPYIFA